MNTVRIKLLLSKTLKLGLYETLQKFYVSVHTDVCLNVQSDPCYTEIHLKLSMECLIVCVLSLEVILHLERKEADVTTMTVISPYQGLWA